MKHEGAHAKQADFAGNLAKLIGVFFHRIADIGERRNRTLLRLRRAA
jgi:hypothetical protein